LQEEGAEVTFMLVDSNEETGKVTGAAEFRYFINSALLLTQPWQTLYPRAQG